jgi:hypothetical protein
MHTLQFIITHISVHSHTFTDTSNVGHPPPFTVQELSPASETSFLQQQLGTTESQQFSNQLQFKVKFMVQQMYS